MCEMVNCASWSTVRVGQLCELVNDWSKLVCWTSVRVECAGEVCEVAKILSVRGGPILSVRAH